MPSPEKIKYVLDVYERGIEETTGLWIMEMHAGLVVRLDGAAEFVSCTVLQ